LRPLKGSIALRLQVHRRSFPAPINFELELESVAFVERGDARALDGRNMHERVGLAVVALDEAEAFHRVEELDRPAGFLAGELALRTAIAAGTATATGALDRHRLTFDAKVGRRNSPAAINEGE